jgi:hypothetical protein
MTDATKLIAGLLLIVMPTIEYGGTFLLGVLSRKYAGFTEFQRSMFRAGHAHAGVLTVLTLVALLFTDQAVPSGDIERGASSRRSQTGQPYRLAIRPSNRFSPSAHVAKW